MCHLAPDTSLNDLLPAYGRPGHGCYYIQIATHTRGAWSTSGLVLCMSGLEPIAALMLLRCTSKHQQTGRGVGDPRISQHNAHHISSTVGACLVEVLLLFLSLVQRAHNNVEVTSTSRHCTVLLVCFSDLTTTQSHFRSRLSFFVEGS